MQHVKYQTFTLGNGLHWISYLIKFDDICTWIHLKLPIVHYSIAASTKSWRPSVCTTVWKSLPGFWWGGRATCPFKEYVFIEVLGGRWLGSATGASSTITPSPKQTLGRDNNYGLRFIHVINTSTMQWKVVAAISNSPILNPGMNYFH
jgi:hypothetical protein